MARTFQAANKSTAVSSDALRGGGDGPTQFFAQGVNYVIHKDGDSLKGRILPARSPDLSVNDTAWKTSVFPYRDKSIIDDQNKDNMGLPVFSRWFVLLKVYRFFGKAGSGFLSPLSLSTLGVEGISADDLADPVLDIIRACKSSGNEAVKALVTPVEDAKRKFKTAPLMGPKTMAAMNFFYMDTFQGKETVGILMSTGMALERLFKTLGQPTVYGKTPRDPLWPEMLFGDVTHPKTGLLATFRKLHTDTGSEFTGITFSARDNVLDGHTVLPVPDHAIASRYNLLSSDVLRIDTYQEIVNRVVADGLVPLEVIKTACGHAANIGASRSMGVPREHEEQPAASSGDTRSFSAPEASPQSSGVSGAEGFLPKEEKPAAPAFELFLHHNKQTTKVTIAEVQELVNQGLGAQLKVMTRDKTSGWVLPEVLGIFPPAPEPEPEPEADDDELPMGPTDDLPEAPEDDIPEAPAEDLPPAPAEEMHPAQAAVSSPNAAKLTPAEAARRAELTQKSTAGTLASEEFTELLALSRKVP
jgi:hypothetical protein